MRVSYVLTDIVENPRDENGNFVDPLNVCHVCGGPAEVYYKWILYRDMIQICKGCLNYAIKEIDRTILEDSNTKVEVLDEDDGYCD